MSDLPPCGGCRALPRTPHIDGCAVARCTECGLQRIACAHGDADAGWGQRWTGRYPGEDDVERFGLADLNDLADRIAAGMLMWDRNGQRWELDPSWGRGAAALPVPERPDRVRPLPAEGMPFASGGVVVDAAVAVVLGVDVLARLNSPHPPHFL
ncbi:hypothetical protein [Actinocorallia aurea]